MALSAVLINGKGESGNVQGVGGERIHLGGGAPLSLLANKSNVVANWCTCWLSEGRRGWLGLEAWGGGWWA